MATAADRAAAQSLGGCSAPAARVAVGAAVTYTITDAAISRGLVALDAGQEAVCRKRLGILGTLDAPVTAKWGIRAEAAHASPDVKRRTVEDGRDVDSADLSRVGVTSLAAGVRSLIGAGATSCACGALTVGWTPFSLFQRAAQSFRAAGDRGTIASPDGDSYDVRGQETAADVAPWEDGEVVGAGAEPLNDQPESRVLVLVTMHGGNVWS